MIQNPTDPTFESCWDGIPMIQTKQGKNKFTGLKLRYLSFADDLVLFAEDRDELQNACDHITSYVKKWKLDFNVSKCTTLRFDPNLDATEYRPLILSGKTVTAVTEFKYLGVWLHQNLKWDKQLNYVLFKGRNAKNKEYNNLCDNNNPIRRRVNIIKRVIIPTITYASVVWAQSESQIEPLQTIINDCFRFILIDHAYILQFTYNEFSISFELIQNLCFYH